MTVKRGSIAIGPLSPGTQGAHYKPKRELFDLPGRITNASSTEPFTGVRWLVRDGGEKHKQFLSRGLG